jgi:hypothetical protein
MEEKTLASSSSDFVRQRSAVYRGLRQVLTEVEASAALVLWTERFSEAGSVFSGLNKFVHDVCTSYNKVSQQRELMQAINKALIIREGEPSPAPAMEAEENSSSDNAAPIPSMEQAAPPVAGQGTANTPEFQTFQLVILGIVDQVQQYRSDLGATCREFIRESVNNMPWSEAQQGQLILLLDTGHTLQTRAYRPGQLKALMSHLTLWMEENLSAAIATRMVEKAITEAEKTTAGHDHSPKLFI